MIDNKNDDFSKYQLDKDIPEKIWSNYMKKYTKKHILFLGEDKIWKIKCRFGQIEPYSLIKGLLSFYGNFPSPNKKTYFLKKLISFSEVVTEGYDEIVIKFKEKELSNLNKLLKVKNRMNLSDEERLRRSETMKENLRKGKCIKE